MTAYSNIQNYIFDYVDIFRLISITWANIQFINVPHRAKKCILGLGYAC